MLIYNSNSSEHLAFFSFVSVLLTNVGLQILLKNIKKRWVHEISGKQVKKVKKKKPFILGYFQVHYSKPTARFTFVVIIQVNFQSFAIMDLHFNIQVNLV